MAILQGIEAKIVVDGRPLPEYEDDEEDIQNAKTVVKYVEATTGSQFGLDLSASESFKFTSNGISFKIIIDGDFADHRLWPKEQKPYKSTIMGASRRLDQGWQERPFIFNDIKCVENSLVQRTRPSSGDIGTISIQFHRRTVSVKSASQARHLPDFGGFETKKEIAETKLKGKGISHSIGLGKAKDIRPLHVYNSVYTDGEDSPIAVFKFKYRSKKALQSMLLISRSPTPVPLEERPVDELNVEELRELARRQRARVPIERKAKDESQSGFKRERDAEYKELLASATTKKVKRSHSSAKVEIIDLSKDD